MSDHTGAMTKDAIPRVILEAAEGARAARVWARTIPTLEPDEPQIEQAIPASAWCTRPPTADERQAALGRDSESHLPQADPVEIELDALASHLVGTAYYANRSTAPELGMVPAAKPNLSVEAIRRAHGCRIGRVRIWKYFSKRGFVCLDCHWLGELVLAQVDGVEPDAAAAARHHCRAAQA